MMTKTQEDNSHLESKTQAKGKNQLKGKSQWEEGVTSSCMRPISLMTSKPQKDNNQLKGKSQWQEGFTSIRVRPISLMMGRTLKGRLMPSWQRYFISSNSPSGGTKLTTFSVLKRPRLTHWWKVTSCRSGKQGVEMLTVFFIKINITF